MKNILIEQTRTKKMKHYFVKPFVPIFARTELRKDYVAFKGWVTQCLPIYTRWEYNWWSVSKTSIPKKVWPIVRARVKKTGQLCLLKMQ